MRLSKMNHLNHRGAHPWHHTNSYTVEQPHPSSRELAHHPKLKICRHCMGTLNVPFPFKLFWQCQVWNPGLYISKKVLSHTTRPSLSHPLATSSLPILSLNLEPWCEWLHNSCLCDWLLLTQSPCVLAMMNRHQIPCLEKCHYKHEHTNYLFDIFFPPNRAYCVTSAVLELSAVLNL